MDNLSRSTSATQSRIHTLFQHISTHCDVNAKPPTPTLGTPSNFENRIETAYHTLGLSTSYPGPPTIPMSVALAKPGNRGKSYTTYLKPLVTTEWIRQLTASHPPQSPHATPTGRTQAHFMIHGPSLYNNLYKIPPYLNICTERNPMSLTRYSSQSHKLISTHKFTIENAQRVTYDQKLCPYCDQQVTRNGIHILLQCPGTKHSANNLIATLSTLLTHSHQPTWNSLTLYQQKVLQTPPQLSPKKFTKHGFTLPFPTFSHTEQPSKHTCTKCHTPCNPLSPVRTLSPFTKTTDMDKHIFYFQ